MEQVVTTEQHNIDDKKRYTCNNEQFYRTTYNGFNILVREKDGYINGTKMVKDINDKTGKQKRLRNIIKQKIVMEFQQQMLIHLRNVHRLKLAEGLTYELKTGYDGDFYGTYVHPKLINIIAIHCDVEYSIVVSQIMDNINDNIHKGLISENEKLVMQLQESQSQLQQVQSQLQETGSQLQERQSQIQKYITKQEECKKDTLYCLTNESYPNMFKIGETTRDVNQRIKELQNEKLYKSDKPYQIKRIIHLEHSFRSEQLVSQLIGEYNTVGEWYKCSYDIIEDLFDMIEQEQNEKINVKIEQFQEKKELEKKQYHQNYSKDHYEERMQKLINEKAPDIKCDTTKECILQYINLKIENEEIKSVAKIITEFNEQYNESLKLQEQIKIISTRNTYFREKCRERNVNKIQICDPNSSKYEINRAREKFIRDDILQQMQSGQLEALQKKITAFNQYQTIGKIDVDVEEFLEKQRKKNEYLSNFMRNHKLEKEGLSVIEREKKVRDFIIQNKISNKLIVQSFNKHFKDKIEV